MYIQIQTTFEKKSEAEKLAEAMLDVKLISCGQIIEIESLYNWSGKRQTEKEFLLVVKTCTELYDECERYIKANHLYKCPQIIALPIIDGSEDYLKWIDESIRC